MRVLLLSAYHASSHAYWSASLQASFPQYDWTVITLPARYFNWRIRGNALHIALEYKTVLAQPFDLIIATSMTDLTGLRSFCPALVLVPSILYFHENQFCYPVNQAQAERIEPQMMTLFSALSATQLVFNSHYNCDTFFSGAAQLLKKLPDCVPSALIPALRKKATVLPVPISDSAFFSGSAKAPRVTFIWNHRWEHDKAPERLLAALTRVANSHCNFTLHVVGQQFRQQPACFAALRCLLESTGTLGAWGFQESRKEYEQLLRASHAVISTALHDFQGLSVLEAVAVGCVPLVPKRLAYAEWFPNAGYDSFEANPSSEAEALAKAMIGLIDQPHVAVVPDVSAMSESRLAPAYERLMQSVAGV